MKLRRTCCFLFVLTLCCTSVNAQSTEPGECRTTPPLTSPDSGPRWNGWGAGASNTRFQPADQARLNSSDISKLKLKWAFGIANVMQSRSQPAIAGGRLFMASDSGAVYSLDPKTGCTYWTFKAQSNVRTAISVGTRALYFDDRMVNSV